MLDRQKVQRIAFERMALSSRYLPRHGCVLCHQVHHTDALLILDMLKIWCCPKPGLPLNRKYGPVRQHLFIHSFIHSFIHF